MAKYEEPRIFIKCMECRTWWQFEQEVTCKCEKGVWVLEESTSDSEWGI